MTNKPDSEYTLGVDISRWDVVYNDYTNTITSLWNPDNATKRIDFVIQKCSDGKNPDKFVNELYEQTLKIPIRAAYHYFRTGLGWKVQLEAILNATNNKKYHFFAIDYEKFYNDLNATSFAEMMELVKQLKSATGKRVIIYFNADIYQNNMKPYNADAVINSIDCWFAQYPYKIFLNLDNPPTALPKNITSLKIFQFGGDTFGCRGYGEGKDWGSPAKSMDINLFYGSISDLHKWAGVDNTETPPTEPPPTPIPTTSRYTGSVLSTTILGLNVRESAVTGMVVDKLNPNQNFEGNNIVTIQNDKWLNISKPMNGWISLKFCKYVDNNEIPPVENPELKPAIPGPYLLLSYRDVGEPWHWENGKLDAYPAVVATKGGNGNVRLSGDGQSDLFKKPTKGFMKSIRDIMSQIQWSRTWVDQEGWHNSAGTGTIRQVEFAHNKKWVTKINADGSYEYDLYYNNDAAPNLSVDYDQYRRGIMTIDYKTGHEDSGGVINSDLLLPYISMANDRTEKLRIDPKYLKPLLYLPTTCKVKTNGVNLNIRKAPVDGQIIGSYKNGESIIVIAVTKVDSRVWLQTKDGFVASWLTDLDI